MEGQPLRITVSADASVRVLGVLAWNPLPDARPVGSNQYEMVIPKTVPPGSYNLTAIGLAQRDVESEPVTIRVEREDAPSLLQLAPPLLVFNATGDEFPLRVMAQFGDGSHLDVTQSLKTSFESKDTQVVRVDGRAMAIAVGPGQAAIIATYAGPVSVYAAMLVQGPRPVPQGPAPEIDSISPETGIPGITDITIMGRHFGDAQGKGDVWIGTRDAQVKRWRDIQIVATVPTGTRVGAVGVQQRGLYSNEIRFVPLTDPAIDAILNMPVPGKQIRIDGSGFKSAQGSGYVTIADVKAEVVSWSNAEIVVIVPEFAPTGWSFQVAVHQDGKSGEFRVISPQKAIAK